MLGRRLLLCAATAALLSSCASAPRAPAATLAEAGRKATSAFGSDVRDISARLEYASVAEAFTTTWQVCANPRIVCEPQQPSEALAHRRQELAKVVALRAEAIEALGQAYAALQTEAAHDSRSDLAGATGAAVSSVNSFASTVAAISGVPGAALLSKPIEAGLAFGAGIVGEQRQRTRILAASRVIGAATARLRDAMTAEAFVFESFADYLGQQRSAAIAALLEAGLISGAKLLTPMTEQLDVKLLPTADATIRKSAPAQNAVAAAVQATSRSKVRAVQDRYRTSIAALDALVAGHGDLEKERPVSLARVERLVNELDAGLARHLDEEKE